jgi:quercetin dioxygenase-like cupin family protein
VGTPGLRVVLLHWPVGFVTVPHVHPSAEEIFQVLRGRAVFTIGSAPDLEVGPGEFMFARRGVQHCIGVLGDAPLTLLAAVAPNEDRPDETIKPVSNVPWG